MAPLQRSKSASQTGQLQIQHFIHQHLLHKHYMTTEFNCDGCNTGGYGVRYQCSACDFDLHEQCATAPHRISSNLHPQHHLILVNRPGDSHLCQVCKGVTNGVSYTCEFQTCEFSVHTLCIQIPVATGDKSLTLDTCLLPGTVATTSVGGYNGAGNNNQPVVMNQHQQSNSQPMMVNHLQHQSMQGMHTVQFGGYNGANNSQPLTVNNSQTRMINHQQQQLKPMGGYGGYQGVNNSQPTMVNHHQQLKQAMPTTSFGGYHAMNNNNQSQMVNHHPQQQQGIPATAFSGYHGGMNSQRVMVNHHQQQQVMPTTTLNTNQQFMTNHHQPQQQGIPQAAIGGYNVVNNNQTVVISHPPPPPPPPQQKPSIGTLAANILSTSIIGVPLFLNRT